jgi:hypothetical protein
MGMPFPPDDLPDGEAELEGDEDDDRRKLVRAVG